jgi:hypothetical protein
VTAWRQVLPGDRVGAICSPSMAHEHGVHQPVLPLCGVAIVGARVNCVVHGDDCLEGAQNGADGCPRAALAEGDLAGAI